MFKFEFYDSGECDRCGKETANIHMEISTRYRDEYQVIGLCWKCWAKLNTKATAEKAQYQTIAEEVKP